MDISLIDSLASKFLALAKKKPWTSFEIEHREKIWKGVGGSVTDCMKKMKGKVKSPGAFCASLERSITKKKAIAKKKDEFKKYRRKDIAELRPYMPGEKLSKRISISAADKDAGSPKEGDMIARNPKNHDDQWLVAYEYFTNNFEPIE